MATEEKEMKVTRGCNFLVDEASLDDVFIPEEFDEEQQMVGQLARDFYDGSVAPVNDEIEALADGVTVNLLKEAGELGLLSVDLPERFGGFAQTKAVSMLVAESLCKNASFNTAFSCHTGIGSLPIVYFGTEEQKQKFLPGLATGEIIGAYALTEAGSGSDALAARTTAVLNDEGTEYVLNGEKLFITNGNFADLFIVFAKVDGEQFTAFIIEKNNEGLSLGAEEKKMGIKGSSTTSVILQDAKVPVENVLGEIGNGARIAFNILNVGRFKLAAAVTGGGIAAMKETVEYAKGRQQFGRPIAEFGMVQHKIAESLSRLYAARSAIYRTAGYIDQNIATIDVTDPERDSKVIDSAIREYMVECSILKVFCSEALDYTVDEVVQIYGGYGYTQEYGAERYYRDSRINRIFEGTNEINRIVVGGEVMKRAAKNSIPLFARAKALLDELTGFPDLGDDDDTSFLANERKLVNQARKIVYLAAGTMGQTLGMKLQDVWGHEELLGLLADLIMETYAMDSAVLRTMKLKERGAPDVDTFHSALTRLYCNEAMARMEITARTLLSAIVEGDDLSMALSGLRRTAKYAPANTVALRREIAEYAASHDDWGL
ncbi:MAG: acyl-CoA dehydrogenase family protein [Acidobacteria bacterium]|uniref:Acyl-CoA dehydrogenase family protein n=1 Tax=Candidatus Polarisedimenticola svalbardensis TaxID=2886004 RepID=A0A8J6XRH4_9BACT|nr:acyl-CoA dehydrogenase family protein [Candidatus Polarisedimenticola svalbardensis]